MRLVEQLQDLVLRARDGPGADEVVDLRHVLGAARRRRIFGVVEQVGARQQLAHRMQCRSAEVKIAT